LLIEDVIEEYDKTTVEHFLDAIKSLGFRFATRAGLTIAWRTSRPRPTSRRSSRSSRSGLPRWRRTSSAGSSQGRASQELIEIWTEAPGR